MRSRSEAAAVAALALGLVCARVGAQAPASPHAPAAAPAPRPSDPEVRSALARVRSDPTLGTQRLTRVLAWQDSSPTPATAWVEGFVGWLGEAGRLLMWVLGSLAAGALAIYLIRLVGQRAARPAAVPLPTHIRDLDIRPESLPADIGAVALALWERGEQRAALALLYRGMLSRLVHGHALPIRESSTEGDCEQLAARHLELAQRAYVSRLIRVWQDAVYGGEPLAPAPFRGLCAELDSVLPGTPRGPAREAA